MLTVSLQLAGLGTSGNNVQEFPDVFSRMKWLRKVHLGSNPLFGHEALTSPCARQIEQLQANYTEVFY